MGGDVQLEAHSLAIQELRWPPEDVVARHVSWNELLVSFRLHSGLCIPIPNLKMPTTYLTPGIHKVFNFWEVKVLPLEAVCSLLVQFLDNRLCRGTRCQPCEYK